MNLAFAIIELVFIGMQTLVWIMIILYNSIPNFDKVLKTEFNHETLSIALLAILAYMIGGIIDGFTAKIQDVCQEKKEGNRDVYSEKSELLALSVDAYNEVMKMEYFSRFLRSTVFNIFIFNIVICIFPNKYCTPSLALLGWGFFLLSIIAFKRREQVYKKKKTSILKAFQDKLI